MLWSPFSNSSRKVSIRLCYPAAIRLLQLLSPCTTSANAYSVKINFDFTVKNKFDLLCHGTKGAVSIQIRTRLCAFMPCKHSVFGGTPNKRSLIVTSPATSLPLTIPPSPSFQTDPFPPVAARSNESSRLGGVPVQLRGTCQTGQERDAQVIRLEQAGGCGRVNLALPALREDGISPFRENKGKDMVGRREARMVGSNPGSSCA